MKCIWLIKNMKMIRILFLLCIFKINLTWSDLGLISNPRIISSICSIRSDWNTLLQLLIDHEHYQFSLSTLCNPYQNPTFTFRSIQTHITSICFSARFALDKLSTIISLARVNTGVSSSFLHWIIRLTIGKKSFRAWIKSSIWWKQRYV